MLGPFRKTIGHRREAAVGAVGLGCLLSVIAFPTLFLNEGRAVRTARALAEGASAVVSVDSGNIDAGNDGKLVHVSGYADTQETLADDQFGVEVNAIRLSRHVEMYQWQEMRRLVAMSTQVARTNDSWKCPRPLNDGRGQDYSGCFGYRSRILLLRTTNGNSLVGI